MRGTLGLWCVALASKRGAERAASAGFKKTSAGPAAVPVSVVRAVRDAGSARQSGATPHLHFGFGLSEIIHQHSCLISQSRQSKQSWHVEQSLHATAPPHAPDDPDTPTHHAQWEAIAHDRASRRKQLAAQMGGRQNPTHTGAAQTPYTSALARCGRRSPLGPISLFTGPVVGVRDRSRLGEMIGPLTNSRNVSDLVHADSRASWLTPHPEHKELAQGPAVGVAVLIELHPLHGFVVKRKRPGVGAWVTC